MIRGKAASIAKKETEVTASELELMKSNRDRLEDIIAKATVVTDKGPEQTTITEPKGETEMNVLTFLAKNWDSVLVVVAFLAVVVVLIKRGETKILKQILFNLVTQAEKQFGSGTGSLKYAAVADWIYQRIPAVLKLLFTSSDIEKMIEAALEEAKKAWGANENLKGYIDTPSVESLLVGIEAQTVQTEPAEN